jgi:hypothetical protein
LKNNLLETRQCDSSNEEADSGTSIKQTKTTTCSRIIKKDRQEMKTKKKKKKRRRNMMMFKGISE